MRAGAREPEQAFQFLRNAIAFGLLPKDAEKSITVVKFDLEDPESLPPAIGNATKVTIRPGFGWLAAHSPPCWGVQPNPEPPAHHAVLCPLPQHQPLHYATEQTPMHSSGGFTGGVRLAAKVVQAIGR